MTLFKVFINTQCTQCWNSVDTNTSRNYKNGSTKLNWMKQNGTELLFTEWNQMAASSVQISRSVVSDSATPWIATRQAFLSITNSRSLPKPTSIESVMPSNHLILCGPLLFLPSIFCSIRVFSNESALLIRWPKYWTSFHIMKKSQLLASVLKN